MVYTDIHIAFTNLFYGVCRYHLRACQADCGDPDRHGEAWHIVICELVCSHNLVVFRGGENALRELQPLLGIIPEARLNLVIYHLKKGDTQLAFDLMKGLEPSLPQVCVALSLEHLWFSAPIMTTS